jgi:hypothetical protein
VPTGYQGGQFFGDFIGYSNGGWLSLGWSVGTGLYADTGEGAFCESCLGQPATLLGPGWHHIAATYTGGAERVYLDGVEKMQVPRGHSHGNGANPLSLGNIGVNQSGPWAGSLDEVAIFDRALSAGEVSAITQAVVLGAGGAKTATVVSTAHAAKAPADQAFLYVEGTADLQLFVSGDDGKTFVPARNGEWTRLGRARGGALRVKVGLPGPSSVLDNAALYWR